MNRWGYRLYYLNDAGEVIAERGLGSPNATTAALDGQRLANESRQRFARWRVVRYEQTEQTIAEGRPVFDFAEAERRNFSDDPRDHDFDERKATREHDAEWYPDDRD